MASSIINFDSICFSVLGDEDGLFGSVIFKDSL